MLRRTNQCIRVGHETRDESVGLKWLGEGFSVGFPVLSPGIHGIVHSTLILRR